MAMKKRTSLRGTPGHKKIEAALERGITRALNEANMPKGEALQLLNSFCARLDFYDRDKRIEIWTLVENLVVKKKLAKASEITKFPGARINGPGLRFKTWLQMLVFAPATRLSEKTIAKRVARAAMIIQMLNTVLDLAWEAFRDTIMKGDK